MRTSRFAVLLFLVTSLLAPAARAATFSSVGSGDWNDGSTWDQAGAVPTSADAVIIEDGHSVTVTTLGDVAQSVTFSVLSLGASLDISPGAKLTLSGDLTIQAQGVASATVDAGDGALAAGNINFYEGAAGGEAKLRIASGGVTAGSVFFTNSLSATNTEIEFYGPGQLTLSGNLASTGTLTNYTTAPGSTVKFAGASGQTTGDYTYKNLTLANTSGGGVIASGPFAVNGTLAISSSFFLVRTASFTVGSSAHLQMSAGAYLKLGDGITTANVPMPSFGGGYTLASTSTIYYGANANQTINPDPPYANLEIAFTGSAGIPVKQLSGNTTVAGNLTIDQQTPATVTLDVAGKILTVGGTLSGDGGLGFPSGGELRLAGNNNHTGTFSPGNGTFTYNGANGLQSARNVAYNNLIVTGNGTNAYITSAGGSAATLAVETGAYLEINNNFSVANLLSVDGTVNGTGDLLSLSNSVDDITGSGDIFANVTCSTRSIDAAANLHFYGNFTIAAGDTVTNYGTIVIDNSLDGTDSGSTFVNASNASASVGGFVMTSGTLNAFATDNTFSYSGLGQTVKPTTYHHLTLTTPGIVPGLKSMAAFPSLVVNGDFTIGGAANFTAPSALDLNGGFTLANTATFDAGASLTHTVGGDWTITGGTFSPNTSNITFDGTAAQAIDASPFHHVWFDNSGSKSLSGTLDVSGDVAVLNSAAVNGNGNHLYIGGSFSDSNGTFTGIGTVTMDGGTAGAINKGNFTNLAIAKTGSGSVLLGDTVNVSGDFSLQSGSFALGNDLLDVGGNFSTDTGTTFGMNSGNLNVDGDLTTDGTITTGTGMLTIDGTSALQTWSGSAPPTIHNLAVSRSSGKLALGLDVTVNGFLNLDDGLVDTGNNKLALTNGINLIHSNGMVEGQLDITHPSAGTQLYPMGTAAYGYSPATVTVSSAGQLPVTITGIAHTANTSAGSDILNTYWTLGAGTISGNVDLTFQWPNPAVNGNELTYVLARYDGSAWSTPGGTIDTANNTIVKTGVTSFTGDWTVAAPASVSSLAELEITTDGTAEPGVTESITITAKDSGGTTLTSYSGDHVLVFSGANQSPSGDDPVVYDKTGTAQVFGNSTTLNFTNGVATTTMELYAQETAQLQADEPSASFTGSQYSVNVVAGAPTELAIVTVNDGNALYANGPFTVSVEAHDDYGNYALVLSDTTVTLSTASCLTCNGSLSGPVSLEIPSGNTAANFSGITYSVAEGNVFIDAIASGGDTLATAVTGALTFNTPVPGVAVTTASDFAAGSLREAIQLANSGACGSPCNITFDILPAGAHVLQLTTRLPAIEVPVILDGESQDGFTGTPIIAIDGNTFTGSTALEFTGGSSTLRGFILNNLSGAAVQLDSDNNVVQNCWIGTDLTGTIAADNGTGIAVSGNNNVIGGNVASARNVISGNSTGIRLHDTASGNSIRGNYIGTNVAGTGAVANTTGILLNDEASSNTIGGASSAERNVVSGNSGAGIKLASSMIVIGSARGIAANGAVTPTVNNNLIKGNYIGVAANGLTSLGNGTGVDLGDDAVSNHIGLSGNGNVISGNGTAIIQSSSDAASNGVRANLIGLAANGTTSVPNVNGAIVISDGNTMEIGGTTAAEANTIANNGGAGVTVLGTGAGHTILGNSILSFGTIPIDLGGDGANGNDAGDVDPGPNGKQNSADLVSASLNGGNIDITASLSTTGVLTSLVEFFEASAGGAMQERIGSTCLAGGTLNNNIITIPNPGLTGGEKIVATVTSYSGASCTNVLYGTSESSNAVTLACPAVPVTITGATSMCAGGSVTLDAGPGFASYAWSTGANTRTITVNPASTAGFSVTVTDGSGCAGTDSHTVTVNPLPTAAISGPASACGTAMLSASGGVSYLWSTAETTQNITVTTSGTYSVTVTDANGCQATTSHNITIDGTPASGITASGPTTFCQGGSVVLTSAPAPSYLWSTGETTQNITVTTGGSYSVQTFNGSCSATAGPVTVTVTPNPLVNIGGPTSACDSAVLDAGTGFQAYLWSTGETTQSITVTSTGTYNVTVTGAGGCQSSDSHAVTISNTLTPVITGPTSACDSAVLDAGTGFQSYLWSTGETTQTITVTSTGSYGVTVTGAGGCTGTDTHTVTITSSLTPVITGPASACDSATLDAGTGFQSYLWSTGETTQTITVTAGGTYSVTVTSAGGCTGTDSHSVTVDPSPTAVIAGPTSACGSAVLDAGAGFNAYLWSTGETTRSITVTATGTYSVTVTGDGGCTATDAHNVTISNANPVIAGPANACGSAMLDAGTAYTSYLWSTGETGSFITVTTSGTYSVTVTDMFGCTGTDSHTVTIGGETPVITGPSSACDTAVLDAGPGYSFYAWSNGQHTRTITVSASGTYSVTVTGAGGCHGTDSHTVTVAPRPTPVITGPTNACDNATLDAGAGFQSYLWSTGETTRTINVGTSGTYSVTVTADGCTGTDSHTVTVGPTPVAAIAGPTSACDSATLDAGAGFNGYLWSTGETTQTITVNATGTYSVTVTGAGGCTATDSHNVTVSGAAPPAITGPASACDSATLDAGVGYQGYLWSTGETTQTITVSTSGTYSVTVTGAGGCTATDSHTVAINGALTPVITGPASACGNATLDAGAGFQSYLWSTGETTRTITVDASGTYSVTVTGAGGCTGSDSHNVTISNTLTPVITGPTSACGNAILDAGAGFQSYLWSTGETTQTITVDASGTYSVTVTGAGGCTGSDSHNVVLNGAQTPVITGPTSACGNATLDAGTGFQSYLWSTGETTQTITVDATGTYSVTVTGAGGCQGSDSHSVTIGGALTPVIAGPTNACSSATLDAGAGFQSYLWSTGETTRTITVSATGTYSVTVTGAGGCQGSDSHSVTIGGLTPEIVAPQSACGNATLDAGAGFQSYLWSTGETTRTITVDATGTYSVTVTGAGGCQGSDSHSIFIGTPAPVSITSPSSVNAGSTGNNASVPFHQAAVYTWGITGGTITSGHGTHAITFKAGAAGTLTLSVTVNVDGCSNADSNNVTVTGAPALPDVKIVKSAPSSVQAGAQFVYAIDVLNLGATDLPGVRMIDTLPDGVVVTGVAQGPWSCVTRGGSIDCTGLLPAKTNRLITVTVNAPQETGSITNTATVQADIDDPTPSNNTSSVTTVVTAAQPNCSTVAPSLVSPADNATTGSPVDFKWNAVPNAFEYELWLVTGGTPQLAGTTGATSLARPLPSGTFSWFVVARFPGDCTPTVSAQRSFTIEQASCTATGAPQLISPAAGSTVGGHVTLGWTPVPLAIGYRVWIEANGTAAQDLGTTNGAITLEADLPPGAIVAYVDALFSGCPPVRSAPLAFTVGRPEPCAGRTAAQPLAPVNSTVDSSNVTFTWLPAAGADAYRVFYSVDGGAPVAAGETVETSLQATVPTGVIRWRVVALREGCGSLESPEVQFTVPVRNDCSTAAPVLLAPANGSTTDGGNVTFTWSGVPNAAGYEVWLSLANGSPALIGTTGSTSLTHVVSPGKLQWFVRVLGDRCPSRDSASFHFTFTPTDACADNQRPVLTSPLSGARVTSPVTFEWTAAPGASGYELFVLRGNQRTPERLAGVTTNSATVEVPAGRIRWFVRASFNGCSPLDSAEEKLQVVPLPAACATLAVPEISASGQVSSGVPFNIRWTNVAGATSYQLQLASSASFTDAQTISTTATRFDLTRTNDGTAPLAVYARVRAIDSRCRPEPTLTPYGPGSAIFILPAQGNDGAVPLDGGVVQYRIPLGPELAGQSFTVAEKEPWLTVTPLSGVVPAEGTFLDVTADGANLPLGTSLGAIRITLDAPAAGTVRANATTVIIPTFGISKATPIMPSSKTEPPPDALIIPAVAHANGINSQFQSDVRVTNSSARLKNYEVTFTPSGDGGLQAGRQTQFAIEPGRTIALDDVLKSWFGTGTGSAVGTLEIRPVAEPFASPVSSATFSGLTDLVTFASSRTFNVTANGTFGQYIPAIPYANFVGRVDALQRPTALSLQQIAQSDQYRTNLGIVEASGEPVSMIISVFGDGGTKLVEFPLNLAGGQHTQLNGFLTAHGIGNLSDGRVEIAVTSGSGKVTAYASVLDNATNDPLLVTPVTLTETGNTKWVMPGVADIAGVGQWRTDMRVFNAGTEDVETTMSFISLAGGEPRTINVTIPAGEVRQFDRTLPSLFGISNDAGAVHISTPSSARLVATGRTYNQATNGTYGQFISAVTPAEAAGVESRPLQLLQVEESPRFRSNLGLAEVTGNPVTIELSFVPPDSKFTAITELTLGPNEFRQLGSVLRSVGMADTFNTRITVRVLSGTGRVTAYASVIDQLTNDPTYVPAQ